MNRKATCACGQLSITVSGDPKTVAACNCIQCQKRTGSVFGVSSFFNDEQVIEVSGESTRWSRVAQSGSNIDANFCPKCGSTVFWKPEFLKNYTGIAVGCFADDNFPEPKVSVWNASRHNWVSFPEHWPSSESQEF